MSKRSDRKWAAKQERADAIREDAKAKPGEYGSGLDTRTREQRNPKAGEYGSGMDVRTRKSGGADKEMAQRRQMVGNTPDRVPTKTIAGSSTPNADKQRYHPVDDPMQPRPGFQRGSERDNTPAALDPSTRGQSNPAPHPESREGLRNQKAAGEAAAKKEEQQQHKAAGEHHLEVAAMHQKASDGLKRSAAQAQKIIGRNAGHAARGRLADDIKEMGKEAANHDKHAAEHTAEAEKHAAAAGGEWDESKHPRDENGKFGS